MKLYSTTTSPFVRKVLVVAHEHGLVDRIDCVRLRPSPLRADADLSGANPLNKIPALVLDDGTAIFDSPVICEYLDTTHGGPTRLLPASATERWRVLRVQALADGVTEAGVLAFYERAQRPASHQWQPWIDGQLEKVRQGLDALDRDARASFPRGGVDLGLIAAGASIGWLLFRKVLDPFEGRPALAGWYEAFSERPSMQATVPHD